MIDYYPIDQLRDEVVRLHESGVSYAQMCRRIGWHKRETSRLQRILGLYPLSKTRKICYKRRGQYETMVLICRACGIDPVDVGL